MICSLCILWLHIIFLPALIYRYRALYILSLINVERKNILEEKWPIFFSLLSFGVEYMQHLVKLFAGGSPAIIHAVQAAPADGSISSIGMWAPSRPLNQPPPPPPKHHQRHNHQQHQHQQAGHSIEPVEPNSQLLPKICFGGFPKADFPNPCHGMMFHHWYFLQFLLFQVKDSMFDPNDNEWI